MARISQTFNTGDRSNITPERLLELMERMYMDLAEAVNSKPDLYERDTDGQTSETFLAQGSININTTTLKVEMLTEHTDPSTVVWTTLS